MKAGKHRVKAPGDLVSGKDLLSRDRPLLLCLTYKEGTLSVHGGGDENSHKPLLIGD